MLEIKRQRRILHCSDLHLESFGSKACYSFKVMVDLAIDAKADLVLIAGDLFDHNRIGADLVNFVVEQLQRLSAYVVILPGNHDCLFPGYIYQKVDIWKSVAHVRIFRDVEGETFTLPQIGMSVWGKPIAYGGGDIQPLVGIPPRQRNGLWHIAVAHGHYVDAGGSLFPSFQITRAEMVASGQDYVALGHAPVFRCVCSEPVKAYYGGSPSVSGTVAVVDLVDEAEVHVACHTL